LQPPEQPHPHAEIEDTQAAGLRIQRLAMFLEVHFGDVELHMPDLDETMEQAQGENKLPPEPALLVRLDEADALINLLSMVRDTRRFLFKQV
jgi:cleavage and polyadenylation specificity factor subunit 3